jgi:hypothetical protein
MGSNEKRSKKSLTDRIKERVRDFVDEVVGAIESLAEPPPVPIPVRPRRSYGSYGR